jgi:phosphinothricin acetyltransferase
MRPLTRDDWPAVERIYADGIATGNATFQEAPPTWAEFDGAKAARLRLVAVDRAGAVVGWAAASPVSTRPVYRGVVEHSVYVAQDAQGRGVGKSLLQAFVETCDAQGVWTIQSAIFPENTASLALHERAGFRVVGTRERIGLMTYGAWAGLWRDNIFLERRRTD